MNVPAETVSTNVPQGTCGCGCGEPCKGQYKRGHNPWSHKHGPAAPSQDAVLAEIKHPISRDTLARKLRAPARWVSGVLTRLNKRRLIRRVGHGMWAPIGWTPPLRLVPASATPVPCTGEDTPAIRRDGICPRCGWRKRQKGQGYCKPCKKAYVDAHRPKWRDLTPEQKRKAKCRAYSRMLEKRGVLKRRPCACGSTRVQRHHFDYDDPYTVEYQCLTCHRRWHQTAETDTGVQTAAARRLLKSEGISNPTPAEIVDAKRRIGRERVRVSNVSNDD